MLEFEYADAICTAAVITPAVTFLCQTMDLPVPTVNLVPEVFRNGNIHTQEGLINILNYVRKTKVLVKKIQGSLNVLKKYINGVIYLNYLLSNSLLIICLAAH